MMKVQVRGYRGGFLCDLAQDALVKLDPEVSEAVGPLDISFGDPQGRAPGCRGALANFHGVLWVFQKGAASKWDWKLS